MECETLFVKKLPDHPERQASMLIITREPWPRWITAWSPPLDPGAEFSFLPKPYSLAQLAAKVKEQIEL